jgi:hypothetical protein
LERSITHNLSWFCAVEQLISLLLSSFLFCIIFDLVIDIVFLLGVLWIHKFVHIPMWLPLNNHVIALELSLVPITFNFVVDKK